MSQSSSTTLGALSLLTVTTGLIDAATVLNFTVFAANMTGNVVFLGFSLGGAPEYSFLYSLSALVGFLLGAWGTGLVLPARPAPRLTARALAMQAVIIAAAIVLAFFDVTTASWVEWLLLGVLGAAMGVQNVVALSSAVPDMKTTVLTLTLASFAADIARGTAQQWKLRLLSVGLLLLGAFVGAWIFATIGVPWTLCAALATTVVAALLFGRAESTHSTTTTSS